jgi:hypothetical protein
MLKILELLNPATPSVRRQYSVEEMPMRLSFVRDLRRDGDVGERMPARPAHCD